MHTDRFHRPDDPALAIFIMRTPEEGSHTGILFRMKGVLIIQDLLWHEKFRSKPADEMPHFVKLSLEPEQEHDVRMRCELIHQRRNDRSKTYHTPYAFRYSNKNSINPGTGEIEFNDGIGVSCSTFVLAVFQSVGIPLVNINTWQAREGDVARHQALLKKMREGIDGWAPPAPPEHIAIVEKEVHCMRVRPEEVAATGMFNEHPATFEQLAPAGAWILSQIPSVE
jgi:hypothetical protein